MRLFSWAAIVLKKSINLSFDRRWIIHQGNGNSRISPADDRVDESSDELSDKIPERECWLEKCNERWDANEGGHSSNTYRVKTSDRPAINSTLNDRDWALFDNTCFFIKLNTELDEAKKRMQQHAACPDKVNKLLFEYAKPKTLKSCQELE